MMRICRRKVRLAFVDEKITSVAAMLFSDELAGGLSRARAPLQLENRVRIRTLFFANSPPRAQIWARVMLTYDSDWRYFLEGVIGPTHYVDDDGNQVAEESEDADHLPDTHRKYDG